MAATRTAAALARLRLRGRRRTAAARAQAAAARLAAAEAAAAAAARLAATEMSTLVLEAVEAAVQEAARRQQRLVKVSWAAARAPPLADLLGGANSRQLSGAWRRLKEARGEYPALTARIEAAMASGA